MSSSGDWTSDDMNPVTLPTIVSPSDLFDGELFGDELMDIYNSTVEGHDENDGTSLEKYSLQLMIRQLSRDCLSPLSRSCKAFGFQERRRRRGNVGIYGWVWDISPINFL